MHLNRHGLTDKQIERNRAFVQSLGVRKNNHKIKSISKAKGKSKNWLGLTDIQMRAFNHVKTNGAVIIANVSFNINEDKDTTRKALIQLVKKRFLDFDVENKTYRLSNKKPIIKLTQRQQIIKYFQKNGTVKTDELTGISKNPKYHVSELHIDNLIEKVEKKVYRWVG